MNTNIYLYIAVMALATYFCRVFAFTVVPGEVHHGIGKINKPAQGHAHFPQIRCP